MNSPTLTDLSSDLSSVGSLSPPPPFDYPSPQSSQEIYSPHLESEQTCSKRSHDSDEQEPAKKRRKAEPKPRTTQYLDIRPRSNASSTDQTCQLDTLYKVLSKRKKIVVIAGAGISVSAGSTYKLILHPIIIFLTRSSSRLSILLRPFRHLEERA